MLVVTNFCDFTTLAGSDLAFEKYNSEWLKSYCSLPFSASQVEGMTSTVFALYEIAHYHYHYAVFLQLSNVFYSHDSDFYFLSYATPL